MVGWWSIVAPGSREVQFLWLVLESTYFASGDDSYSSGGGVGGARGVALPLEGAPLRPAEQGRTLPAA